MRQNLETFNEEKHGKTAYLLRCSMHSVSTTKKTSVIGTAMPLSLPILQSSVSLVTRENHSHLIYERYGRLLGLFPFQRTALLWEGNVI